MFAIVCTLACSLLLCAYASRHAALQSSVGGSNLERSRSIPSAVGSAKRARIGDVDSRQAESSCNQHAGMRSMVYLGSTCLPRLPQIVQSVIRGHRRIL
eukprot:4603725-Prymnesium_polylepis.2